jgi:hypothetical protein
MEGCRQLPVLEPQKSDNFTSRFVELDPPKRVVQAVTFNSTDPATAGGMVMAAAFEAKTGGTKVTVVCEHIPPGIRPEDNEAGCRSSLEKLARDVQIGRSTCGQKPRSKVIPATHAGAFHFCIISVTNA